MASGLWDQLLRADTRYEAIDFSTSRSSVPVAFATVSCPTRKRTLPRCVVGVLLQIEAIRVQGSAEGVAGFGVFTALVGRDRPGCTAASRRWANEPAHAHIHLLIA